MQHFLSAPAATADLAAAVDVAETVGAADAVTPVAVIADAAAVGGPAAAGTTVTVSAIHAAVRDVIGSFVLDAFNGNAA